MTTRPAFMTFYTDATGRMAAETFDNGSQAWARTESLEHTPSVKDVVCINGKGDCLNPNTLGPHPKDETVLVLFSGGNDSFLAACRLIMAGHSVRLLSFNNGAVANERILVDSAKRLANRYGPDKAVYDGCYNTAAAIQRLRDWQADLKLSEFAAFYPDLCETQLMCLLCQTAMWASAAAYAEAKDIKAVACGYRQSDVFCTGWNGYVRRIKDMLEKHGLRLKLPVWSDSGWTDDPFGRKLEMENDGFLPVAYEPKCLLGRPARCRTTALESDMARYLDDIVLPAADAVTEKLVPVFKHIKLSPESLRAVDCPIPDGSKGFY